MTNLKFVHDSHTENSMWGFVYATGQAERFASMLLNPADSSDFVTPDFVAPAADSDISSLSDLTSKFIATKYVEIDCAFYNRPALLCLWKDSCDMWRGRVALNDDLDLEEIRKVCLTLALNDPS